jgi:uncharacterized protein YndB with AHSA1/START domain
MAEDAVVIRRTIPASAERLFDAWTDPEQLARWMSPIGHAVVEVDARAGGRIRVTMAGEGRTIEHTGEYLAIERPHRLVFSWRSPYTGGVASRVTVELSEGAGGTELTLRHELLPLEAISSHAGGWGTMLDRLAALLSRSNQGVARGA